jgi:archaeal flagellar protein FlaJ
MKLKRMHWFGIIAAILIISFGVVFFYDNQKMLMFLAGVGVGVAVLPFIISITFENQKEQKLNEMFLEFTRNLAESVAAGTPISKGIVNVKKKNYGVLNPYVQKLANQVELGIPVDRALQTFADDVDSDVVKRAAALIRGAEKAGGEIDYILDSTAKSISEVEKLKAERRSAIYGIIVQGYTIFFIFIGIVLVMEFKIVPLTAGVSGLGGFTSGNIQGIGDPAQTNQNNFSPEMFTKPFLFLLLTQGLFMGLVVGKIAEGSVKKGIKHSFILMIAAFLISNGARLFITPG